MKLSTKFLGIAVGGIGFYALFPLAKEVQQEMISGGQEATACTEATTNVVQVCGDEYIQLANASWERMWKDRCDNLTEDLCAQWRTDVDDLLEARKELREVRTELRSAQMRPAPQ